MQNPFCILLWLTRTCRIEIQTRKCLNFGASRGPAPRRCSVQKSRDGLLHQLDRACMVGNDSSVMQKMLCIRPYTVMAVKDGIRFPSSYRRVTPVKTGAVASERQKHFLLGTGGHRYDGFVFFTGLRPPYRVRVRLGSVNGTSLCHVSGLHWKDNLMYFWT
jgi:hypothetical protein